MTRRDNFIEAIKSGDIDDVRRLIADDSSLVSARTDNGVSAVLIGMYHGHPEISRLLIDQGARLDIFSAAGTGEIDTVRELLEKEPSLINEVAPDGFHPLGLACFFGHSEIVEYLLSRSAAVNSASQNARRVMPLHSAVASGNLEIAKMLLEQGADVNAVQSGGFTPLHAAAHNGQAEMVELLLSCGASRDMVTDDGRQAADFAAEEGHSEVMEILKREQ